MLPRWVGSLIGLSVVATAGLSGSALAGPISNQFALTGDVVTPGIYDLATLEALPPTTLTATYLAGKLPTSVTDTYTGTNLWSLLTLPSAGGGLLPIPGAPKNPSLRNYVVAVGSDGYEALFAVGEINPKFGNRPYMVAYGDTGGQLGPGGPDGFARMVVPGDVYGGRYVSNLVALSVGHAPTLPGSGGGLSTKFKLVGDVSSPGTYTLSSLEALPATTLTATYMGPTGSVTDTYTGVSLWTLINDAGLVTDPFIKNDVLRKYVVAVGSDGYEAVFSLGEIDPMFGDQPDLVAYADTLGQLGPDGSDGFARMVVPGDIAGGRYVSNLIELGVFDASVPEPRGIALFVAAVLALAFVQVRRPSRN
jgi:hypothetical protein